MKLSIIFLLALAKLLAFLTTTGAYHETAIKPVVLGMSDNEQIELAMSAAPPSISKDAAIMILDKDIKYRKVRAGSNGFTWYSDLDKIDIAVPTCMDAAAVQWWNDFVQQRPKSTNKAPRIAYMAKGALRWEKDGKIFMDWHEPGTKRVKDPPHWLILWPFDSNSTKLPTYPDKFGTYIMYDGSPYSHLMIFQDPLMIGKYKLRC